MGDRCGVVTFASAVRVERRVVVDLNMYDLR